jgi:hypothetical protein
MDINEIRQALIDLRSAYRETSDKLSEKSKQGLNSDQTDFVLIEEAKNTINANAEDWLWYLLQEVQDLRASMKYIAEEITKRTQGFE